MSIAVRSFAKINLGLKIGPARADGFHQLRTIYQTLALHDVVRVEVQRGSGIEIRCNDPRVPLDESNTCYQAAERVLKAVEGRSHARAGQPGVPQGLKPSPEEFVGGTAKAVPFQNQSQIQNQSHRPDPSQVPNQDRFENTERSQDRHQFQNQDHEKIRIGRVIIEIDKRLPVQGGLGAGSSNAVATMLGLERALGTELAAEDKMLIAAEIGSDVPLFLIGGTVLGIGRGEEVYPLPDLPRMNLVVVTPPISVSTPKAFAQWDKLVAREAELTGAGATGTINKFSQAVDAWLKERVFSQAVSASGPASGVPAMGGDRAETPLLDLVRAGIENDFERVVFPEYPDLREVKRVLECEGARYASLSGSGSTVYGLFGSGEEAQAAAARMCASGHAAVATTTLTREEYWKQLATSN
ncbi:MAG: 4-(cytidine 5'-diphospho)-2-C-methyl-D-erythritol kinase [Candidatus Korobacteraceae bacterium]